MLGMSKVFKDAGSSVMVDTLQRGQWSSNDLFSSPYHSLQAYVVHSTGVLVPHGDAADQDALDRVAVEVAGFLAACQTSTASSGSTATAEPSSRTVWF